MISKADYDRLAGSVNPKAQRLVLACHEDKAAERHVFLALVAKAMTGKDGPSILFYGMLTVSPDPGPETFILTSELLMDLTATTMAKWNDWFVATAADLWLMNRTLEHAKP
jgi:hypothetical protein